MSPKNSFVIGRRKFIYLFNYSQSLPPNYLMLPHSVSEIFQWFSNFSNDFFHITPLDLKYPFPGIDNLGNSNQVQYYICKYIVLLYIRHFYLNNLNFNESSILPENIIELEQWDNNLKFFTNILKQLESEKELITALNLEVFFSNEKNFFFNYLQNEKSRINEKIIKTKINSNLSQEKVKQFEEMSDRMFNDFFNTFSIFINTENVEKKLSTKINGFYALYPKSAFTDNDIPQLNFDSTFGSTVIQNSKKEIFETFDSFTSTRYLFNKDNLNEALNKLKVDKNYMLLVFDPSYHVNEILENSKYSDNIILFKGYNYHVRNTIFITKTNCLPNFSFNELDTEKIKTYQLKKINNDYNLYTSIVDINKDSTQSDKGDIKEISQDIKVQISIQFDLEISWNDNTKFVKIDIASEFKEKGIQNDINDIKSLKKEYN
ncbi:hypothetical protein HHU12_29360 [Flammeovirga aprica JL-4]|uniref:Uncharacterized protein n=2 Tax=Flammeovirga aprica TaxID=29528 RepID=A0A7X9S0C0_9BACT|nr:hypothetical protein [Flammeovirga aprica JL-4]